MLASLLLRGMLTGIIAGLLAFGFAKTVGEPQVDRAIGFEAQLARLRGEVPEPKLVSRKVQSGVGLLTGVLVYGTGVGGLFALSFAAVYGRVGRGSPRTTAALLALGGFLTIILVPFLKYPANPPSVGLPETIGFRTGLYFLMIIISLLAMGSSVWLARHLAKKRDLWNAILIAAASFLGVIVIVQLLLPDINEVPEGFPSVVLWRFRLASLGIHLVLWTSLGLLFGYMAEGILNRPSHRGLARR